MDLRKRLVREPDAPTPFDPGDAHGLEIAGPLAARSTCDRCHPNEPVHRECPLTPG